VESFGDSAGCAAGARTGGNDYNIPTYVPVTPTTSYYYAPPSGDLDCATTGHEVNVSGSDPNGLDAAHDGVGCEGW
jgi:hypothetical protein